MHTCVFFEGLIWLFSQAIWEWDNWKQMNDHKENGTWGSWNGEHNVTNFWETWVTWVTWVNQNGWPTGWSPLTQRLLPLDIENWRFFIFWMGVHTGNSRMGIVMAESVVFCHNKSCPEWANSRWQHGPSRPAIGSCGNLMREEIFFGRTNQFMGQTVQKIPMLKHG